jgi:hypothetical protein
MNIFLWYSSKKDLLFAYKENCMKNHVFNFQALRIKLGVTQTLNYKNITDIRDFYRHVKIHYSDVFNFL